MHRDDWPAQSHSMYSDDADSDCDGIHEARMQRLVFDSPNAEQLDNNDLLKDV